MRVYAIVLCLVLGAATGASAQEAVVGAKVGINVANVQFEAEGVDVSFDRRIGFVGGLFVIVPANRRIALQAEALFSQKGMEFDEEGIDAKVKLDYLEVPLLLRVGGAQSGRASFHAFGGPSLGFRLRARGTGGFEGEEEDEDLSDDVKGFDLGLVVGAGVEVGRIVVDGRYTWGLTNIAKGELDEDNVKVKNRVFAVMVGVRFN